MAITGSTVGQEGCLRMEGGGTRVECGKDGVRLEMS